MSPSDKLLLGLLRLMQALLLLALMVLLCGCRLRHRQEQRESRVVEQTDSLRRVSTVEQTGSALLRSYILEHRQSEDSLILETERLDTLGRVRERTRLSLRTRERETKQSRQSDSLALFTHRSDSLSWQTKRMEELLRQSRQERESKGNSLWTNPLFWFAVIAVGIWLAREIRWFTR